MAVLETLQKAGINAELYPDIVKMKKQMRYADQRNIPYVMLIGEQEMESKQYTLKSMTTGEQEKLTVDEIISKFVMY